MIWPYPDAPDISASDIEQTGLTISDAVPLTFVGVPGYEALGYTFKSDNPAFDGASSDAWFVYRGSLYQLSTYARDDALLKRLIGVGRLGEGEGAGIAAPAGGSQTQGEIRRVRPISSPVLHRAAAATHNRDPTRFRCSPCRLMRWPRKRSNSLSYRRPELRVLRIPDQKVSKAGVADVTADFGAERTQSA